MPREKDAEKRLSILIESKRLFASLGFHAASVSDIAKAVDLPVGSIYTYFKNKDEIIQTIIDEGWGGFKQSMSAATGAEPDPVKRLGLIIDRFLPELFKDVDFISILLTEAVRIGSLEEKIAYLSDLIVREIKAVGEQSGRSLQFDEKQALSALLVFFLGSMNAVRFIHESTLPVGEKDIVSFIHAAVENALNVRLPDNP
jgi:AcrR family transcriptional regulator